MKDFFKINFLLLKNADKMPSNTTCDFEKGWCGWINVSEKNIKWERTNKPSQSKLTGPSTGDHTFNHNRTVSGTHGCATSTNYDFISHDVQY